MKLLCVAGAMVALCLLTASAALADTSGLVAAYGFEEPGGTTATDSAGLNPGTLNGPTRSAAGRFGAALSFDGVNDRVDVADSNSLDLSTGMTLEAWVQPTALNWRTAVMKERPGGIAYALYASTDTNRPSAEIQAETRAPAAIATNVWTHLASTYDGATLRLYVNGTQVASRAVSGALTISTGALRIGGNAVWGEYFKGLIDEVRIYNRPLTAAEIGTDMNTPVVGADTTPPTAPSLTGTVSGDDVHLSWTASTDNVGVKEYRVYRDGNLLVTRNAGMLGDDDLNRPVGTYRYAVVAVDDAGNASAVSNEVALTVEPDTTPPTVGGVCSTGDANTIHDYITLHPSAVDDRGGDVTVRIEVDGNTVYGPRTQGSGAFLWDFDTLGLSNGTHTLKLIARDAAGNEAATPACEWNVHNPVLSVPITSPANGATVSGTVTINAKGLGDGQPLDASFRPYAVLSGATGGGPTQGNTYSWTWDTTKVPDGEYTLTAHLYILDYGGARATDTIHVTVDNTDSEPPSAPELTGTVTNDDVHLSWSASSDNVGVKEYRVFRDGSLVATRSASTLVYDDVNRPTGTQRYTVVAVDAAGNKSAESNGVALTVEPDTTPPTFTIGVYGLPPDTNYCPDHDVSDYVPLLRAFFRDDRGPVTGRVELDGQTIKGPNTATDPPSWGWQFDFETVGLSNGPHLMRGIARDAAGNETVVECVWHVNNPAYEIPITSPADGATVSGIVTVTAAPTIGGTPTTYPVSLTGAPGATRVGPKPEWTWDTTRVSNGEYTLTTNLYNPSYSQPRGTYTIHVTVNNPPSGLVAAYGFEETAGTSVTDSSGKGNAGTITGGATSAAAGRFGRALSFDGIDDMVSVPDANALDLAPGMTLEAWVKPTTVSDWRTVILKERPGQLVYALYAAADNSRPQTEIATNAGREARGTAALPVGVWSHLAATYDGATLRLYVNGTQVASTAAAGTLVNSAGALRIGGNGIWGERFSGLIDEVRVYERALSAAEIQADRDRAIL